MLKRYLSLLAAVWSSLSLCAQSTNAPLDQDYYHLVQRYEIKSGGFAPGFHSNVKPYLRSDIADFVDTLYSLSVAESKTDDFNLQYLANDNWEWSERDQNDSRKPLFKALYQKQSDLYYVDNQDFDLHVSPVFHFGFGFDKGEDNLFINSRGLVVRGMISRKVGFYTYLVENQMRFPTYVRDWMNHGRYVVPGEGFWKNFKTNGVDFFTARGYISFNAAKFINFQFGHDKQYIGNGFRSLVFSDFSNNNLFLKINTNVWRLDYSFIISEMRADAPGNSGGSFSNVDFPKKYLAFHRLGINITDQLNLGVFESVVFGQPQDSIGTSFELDYLNPIIFYRAIEQSGGSQDNALLGADLTWNFLNRFSLYGQIVFDEFLLKEVKSGNGWWGNKISYQMGLKYIDVFGINNLDLQLEGNFARPYTYAHNNNYTSYSHYKQSLAHPLEANFKEFVAIARYQPIPRLQLSAKLITAKYGTDTDSTNWGQNILKNYDTREMDFNNEIGQGVATDLFYFDFRASYQLKHNLFIDFTQVFRNLNSELPERDQNNVISSLSIRLNIPRREHVF
ncbi:MAG: hypothetical protein DHS20C17_08530 [Cyclobacteriaceae bacterium]|nr:MAG: hypothetical protein DHS20C17_08530 [Cyclobacteriaceae bacterium]